MDTPEVEVLAWVNFWQWQADQAKKTPQEREIEAALRAKYG